MNSDVLLIDDPRPGVRRLTLNRPEKRNALNVELLERLDAALDFDGRVVVVAANGPAFCAGLDLKETGDAERSASLLASVYRRLIGGPFVSVAVAQGPAVGGGVGLLLAADLAVATSSVALAFPELRRGIVPALVAALLRRKIGDGTTRSMLLTGRPMGAAEAARVGLLHAATEDVGAAEAEVVEAVLAGAPGATAVTKRLLDELGDDLDAAFGAAHAAHVESRESSEFEEGARAFREKHAPSWAS